MVGVGKAYDTLIASASADCNLTEKKVKVILKPVKLRVVVMVFLFLPDALPLFVPYFGVLSS